jgi:DNA-binding Lrp family transcriptional regulator
MPATPTRHWTFLSNHAQVLVCLGLNPDARLRDVAAEVGITERAVQGIVGDLEAAGVIVRERLGRRNTYRLNLDAPLRHPLEAHRSIRALLSMVLDPAELKRLPTA